MNSLPTTEALAATLAEARRVAADLVTREQQWQREATRRRSQAARIADQARTRSSEDVRQARDSLAARHRDEAGRSDRRNAERIEAIQRAQHACRSKASQRIEQHDGRAIFGFQKGTLDADRDHAAAIGAANEAFALTTEAHRQATDAFHATESALASAFAGWRGLRRSLLAGGVEPAPNADLDESALLDVAAKATEAASALEREARRHPVAVVFRWLRPWLVGTVAASCALAAVWGFPRWGRPAVEGPVAAGAAAAVFAVFLLLRLAGWSLVRSLKKKKTK